VDIQTVMNWQGVCQLGCRGRRFLVGAAVFRVFLDYIGASEYLDGAVTPKEVAEKLPFTGGVPGKFEPAGDGIIPHICDFASGGGILDRPDRIIPFVHRHQDRRGRTVPRRATFLKIDDDGPPALASRAEVAMRKKQTPSPPSRRHGAGVSACRGICVPG